MRAILTANMPVIHSEKKTMLTRFKRQTELKVLHLMKGKQKGTFERNAHFIDFCSR